MGPIVQNAGTEQEALEGRQLDMKDDELQSFWSLQNQLNQASAQTLSYEESCAALRLSPLEPKIGNVRRIEHIK